MLPAGQAEPKPVTLLRQHLRAFMGTVQSTLPRNHPDLATTRIPGADVKKLLEALLDEASPELAGLDGALAILQKVEAAARVLRTKKSKLDAKLRDAVLVDFINFSGNRWCIDYVLRVSDLEKAA